MNGLMVYLHIRFGRLAVLGFGGAGRCVELFIRHSVGGRMRFIVILKQAHARAVKIIKLSAIHRAKKHP